MMRLEQQRRRWREQKKKQKDLGYLHTAWQRTSIRAHVNVMLGVLK